MHFPLTLFSLSLFLPFGESSHYPPPIDSPCPGLVTVKKAVSKSLRVAEGRKCQYTAWLRAFQRFSIGLRSGEEVNHSIRAIPSLFRKSSMMVALRGRALFSVKTNEEPTAAAYSFTMVSRTSSRYRHRTTHVDVQVERNPCNDHDASTAECVMFSG
ncbi:hypothetical protein TNCV_2074851 [Trichonephila clavipes]|nr:hypothetical protein TNCV_2074851 [Trichonephila clavipes]